MCVFDSSTFCTQPAYRLSSDIFLWPAGLLGVCLLKDLTGRAPRVGHLTAADPFHLSHVSPGKIVALLCVVEQIQLGTDPGSMARRSWRPRAVLLKESAGDTVL